MDSLDLLSRVAKAKPKKNRVLFFGRNEFSDNSKYLYLHCIEANPGFEFVWCTRNQALAETLATQGLPVFDMGTAGTAKTLNFLIESATAVFCTNMMESLGKAEYLQALSGTRKIQLWHGVSIKKLDMMMSPYMDLGDQKFLWQLNGVIGMDHMVSPSTMEDDFWRQAFGFQASQIIRAGLPRNELLTRPAKSHELINSLDSSALLSVRKAPFVLFCPTFSRTKTPLWEDPAIVGEILKFTLERGGHLIIKPHPFEANLVPSGGLFDDAFTVLPASLDIYPLLASMDLLVSDYSSLFIDFLLTGKPIMTVETPEMRSHDYLMHKPERYLCAGPVATAPELIFDVLSNLADSDLYREARQTAAQRAFETNPASACAEIVNFIESQQNGPY